MSAPDGPGPATAPFTGVVLTGGRSVRMGADKAFLVPDDGGPELVVRALHALEDAGARVVLAVGRRSRRLDELGFLAVDDLPPPSGPLGGLLTGLAHATDPVVVVLTCDMPAIDATTVLALRRALDDHPEADAAIPVSGGRRQVLTAAYRTRARPALEASFEAGERSVRRAVEALAVHEVLDLDPDLLADVDRPEDLARYARSGRHPGGRDGGDPAASG
jgi:molybdopterin-guanine dinucleotide biosynthesis protein A